MPKLTLAYCAGRVAHQKGRARLPLLNANVYRHPTGSDARRDAIADYDRGYSQSLAERAPSYGKAWPADIGL
jgi:hypothetical protein